MTELPKVAKGVVTMQGVALEMVGKMSCMKVLSLTRLDVSVNNEWGYFMPPEHCENDAGARDIESRCIRYSASSMEDPTLSTVSEAPSYGISVI